MDKLIIEGGRPLRGSVTVSGAKNAALPILFGAILCESPVTFRNVPDLRDIHTTLTLLDILGCGTSFAEGTVRAVPGALRSEAPYDLVRTMRASVLCLGPLLARLGRARVAMPGGCAIGARPVDLHLSALEKMGARFDLEEGYIQGRVDGGLRGARIQFDFPTVGGTENLIMAAALARGETLLENAAREPEIVDLVRFLRRCGARIEGEGGGTLRIEGVPSLQGCEYAIMPDRIEAGTFLVAAAITDGELTLLNCPHDDMEALLTKLEASGLSVESRGGGLTARRAGGVMRGVDIATLPHPGFPTDMQAQFMALLCLAEGASSIEETIFENRFMHVPELLRMGANIRLSGSSAFIRGVKALAGAPVMASDLRASASLVLAGLAARGTTTVRRIYHLDRGYEHMERKLQAVGAAIRRVRDDA